MELVWVRVRVEEECFWVNLREDNKVSESKMAVSESNMAEFRHCHLGFKHLVIFFQIHSKNTLTLFWLWLKLIQSDSNSFILTQLDDGSHFEFCHLGVSHVSFSSKTDSHSQRLVSTIWTKKISLIHSDSTWRWQPSWILLSWIEPFYTKLWLKLVQSDSNSFILTQLDDISHPEFCHVGFKMAAIIKLSQNEWVKFSFVQNGWIHDGRVQDGWYYQVESEWMSLSQIELAWVRVLCKMAESKMADFKMAAIIRLIRLN